jgi:predicted enzyme related to lactoylglutathione lyase
LGRKTIADAKNNNRFCWNELATKDGAACTKFYCDLFGWTPHVQNFGPTTYTTFRQEGQDVGGLLQMTAEWGDMPAHWMAYVGVPDVDACAKRIVELGGKVCVPPTDISVGRFAVVSDPSGATFSIITLK